MLLILSHDLIEQVTARLGLVALYEATAGMVVYTQGAVLVDGTTILQHGAARLKGVRVILDTITKTTQVIRRE
ncbi:MAG: hypothetical protein M3R24_28280 [Chloroflexota bacterium]|nr:hypothetical protein [Chloroflexota bacterium]